MIIYITIVQVDDICGACVYRGTSFIKAVDAARQIINNDERKNCFNKYQCGYALRGWRDVGGSHIRKIYVDKEWF